MDPAQGIPIRFEKTAILEALDALAKKDPKRKVFGAEFHRYRLNPPLRSKTVETLEKKHRISLPEDYRYFITAVGNGGAGPYYGVFRFGECDEGHGFSKWDDGVLVGDLSEEFAHSRAWNLPKSFFASVRDFEPGPDASEQDQDRLYEEWNQLLQERYWNPAIMNGAIPICHLGCAYRHWLVVNGKEKGFVWADDRPDDRGIRPLRTSSRRRVTFADWYLAWLRDPKKAVG